MCKPDEQRESSADTSRHTLADANFRARDTLQEHSHSLVRTVLRIDAIT